mmetsp:Transcript_35108/g.111598  ORF Transcript_35108/g.111598 Transcript_35108/m.111598 type:complete len:337 (+) Transcript_35108:681-1691(+)
MYSPPLLPCVVAQPSRLSLQARNLRRKPPLLDCTCSSEMLSSTSPASMRRSILHCVTSATSVMAMASTHLKKLLLGCTRGLCFSRTWSQPVTALLPCKAPRTRKSEAKPSLGPSRSSTTSPMRKSRTLKLDTSGSLHKATSCVHHRKGLSERSTYGVPALLRTVVQPVAPSLNARHRRRSKPRLASFLGVPMTSSSSPGISFRIVSDLISKSFVRLTSRTILRTSAIAAARPRRPRPCGESRSNASWSWSAGISESALVRISQKRSRPMMSSAGPASSLNKESVSPAFPFSSASLRKAATTRWTASDVMPSSRSEMFLTMVLPCCNNALQRVCNRL